MGVFSLVWPCGQSTLRLDILCALSRFTARRGVPSEIFSDSGTNFIGAPEILKEEFKKLQSSESQAKINDRLQMKEITWHFNPPPPPVGKSHRRSVGTHDSIHPKNINCIDERAGNRRRSTSYVLGRGGKNSQRPPIELQPRASM